MSHFHLSIHIILRQQFVYYCYYYCGMECSPFGGQNHHTVIRDELFFLLIPSIQMCVYYGYMCNYVYVLKHLYLQRNKKIKSKRDSEEEREDEDEEKIAKKSGKELEIIVKL